MPAVGDTIEIQDLHRRTVLAGSVRGVDAEATYLSTVGLVAAGMATALGGIGLAVVGLSPFVAVLTAGALTANAAGASSLAVLFAGGAAALAGFGLDHARRAKRDTVASQAEEAKALSPYSWEWSAAQPKAPGLVRRTLHHIARALAPKS
jgi:hypothetical protein